MRPKKHSLSSVFETVLSVTLFGPFPYEGPPAALLHTRPLPVYSTTKLPFVRRFWVLRKDGGTFSPDPPRKSPILSAIWVLTEEEGRGTRSGYEASKGSKGISGL